MKKDSDIGGAIYRKIAIDIAYSIVDGKYAEGQKLFGRSVLSSQYNVSPETIRKAIFLLKDVGVLTTEKGSGIEVVSMAKAKEFVERFNGVQSVVVLKNEIVQWTHQQQRETAQILDKIRLLVDMTDRLKIVNPLIPFELHVARHSAVEGLTIAESNFWHNTGATVVAIKRGETLLISPGPYANFFVGDVVYLVGNEQAYITAKNFVEEPTKAGG